MNDKIDPISPIKLHAQKKAVIIGIILLTISCGTAATFPIVEEHQERMPTILTHVNGNRIYNQTMVLYDGNNPQSVTLEILEYVFNGSALSWRSTNTSITFTLGKLSQIAYYNYDDPIWYNITYLEKRALWGTEYAVVAAEQVQPVISYTTDNEGMLTWRDI